MVGWKSPEEAEAWWAEMQELKEKVAWLEKRLVDNARYSYGSYLALIVGITPPPKSEYVGERASHYGELIDKSKDEKEMMNHLNQFIKEITTYAKSG